jgi:hypothetical protein
MGQRWLLFAAVENLFDEEVEAGQRGDGLLTLAAPRLFHVGARLRFSAGN